MARAALCGIMLGLGGCFGGLDNEPFRPGSTEVRGVLAGPIDPAVAWVAVVGRSDLVSLVDAAGGFVIPGVPAGSIDLAASTGMGRATRQSVDVYAGRPVELELSTEPGVTIVGRVELEAGTAIAATLDIEGLPASAQAELVGGAFTISGLPKGTLRLSVAHEGHRSLFVDLDSAPGETHDLGVLHLPRIFEIPRLACEPCVVGTDCASGFCADGHSLGVSERVCVDACETGGICGRGFDCLDLGGHHGCWPRATTCEGFDAQRRMEPCDSDETCGANGAADAVCADHRCAVHCADELDCPEHWSCSAGSPSVCVP